MARPIFPHAPQWTSAQDAILIALWPRGVRPEILAYSLGRTEAAVCKHATELRLRRHRERPLGWWNEDRREAAFQMQADGYSASAIAGELGCTKGAVIGLWNRRRRLNERFSTFEERLARYPEPKGCRYPIGDPLEKIVWCDAPITVFGRVYCDSHHEKCWYRREEP